MEDIIKEIKDILNSETFQMTRDFLATFLFFSLVLYGLFNLFDLIFK